MKLYLLAVTAISFISISCKDSKLSHDLKPAEEYVKVELTEDDIKSIGEFEKALSLSIYEQDSSFLNDNFNFRKLIDIAGNGLDIDAKEKKLLMGGAKKGARQSKERLVETLIGSQFKYLNLIQETKPALLYRIILPDSTFTYGEFLLAKDSSEEWEIVDMNLYTNGKHTSEMLRETYAQVLGVSKENKKISKAVEQIPMITNDIHTGNYQKAWDAWETIDPVAHKNRLIVGLGYMAAIQLYSNDLTQTEPLKKISAIMNKNFPDDTGIAIMDLAVHEINEDFDKYRESIEKIRLKVGDDGFLDLLLAGVDIEEGNYDKAIKVCDDFMKEEPEVLMARFIIMYAYLGKKDYSGLIEELNDISTTYGLEVSVLQEDEDFMPFFESEEGKAWLLTLDQ